MRTRRRPLGAARFLPILDWLPSYEKKWWRPDLIAGLTVWALLIPEATTNSVAMPRTGASGLSVRHICAGYLRFW